MTEMAPVGYVGVSPKCILGFNKVNISYSHTVQLIFITQQFLFSESILCAIHIEHGRGDIPSPTN